MATGRVDSIYDISSLEAEQAKFLQFLQDSKAGILDLNAQRIVVKSADLSSFTQATQDLNKAIDQSVSSTTKATASKSALTSEINKQNELQKQAILTEKAALESKKQQLQIDNEVIKQITLEEKAAQELAKTKGISAAQQIAADKALQQAAIARQDADNKAAVTKAQVSKIQADLDLKKAQADKVINSTAIQQQKQDAAVLAAQEKKRIADEKLLAASQKLTAQQKLEQTIANSASGSYTQLNAQLKSLENEYKSLSETERNSGKGQGILQNIQTTKGSLKELDSSLGDHQRKVGSYADAIAGSFEHIFSRVLEYVGSYEIINGLTSFIKGTAEAAIEAEAATFKFEGTLDNLGRLDALERLTTSAKKLHDQFQFFGEPEIIGVFEKLVTFGKLTENQINQLTPIILNFAAKSPGLSLQEATTSVLSAIEGNGKGLKQYGINIKDAKTEVERFGLIVDQLGPKVKGAGDAFGSTTQGKIEATKIKFKELEEELGENLLPTINNLLSGFNHFLVDLESGGVGKVVDRVKEGLGALLDASDYNDLVSRLNGIQKKVEDVKYSAADSKKVFTFQIGKSILPEDYGLGQAPLNLDKPFDGGKGLDDTTKDKAGKQDNFLKESIARTKDYNKKTEEENSKAIESEITALQNKYQKEYEDQNSGELERIASLQNYYDSTNDLIEKQRQREIESNDANAKAEEQKAKEAFVKSDKTKAERIQLGNELNSIEKNRLATADQINADGNKKIQENNVKYAADTLKIVDESFKKDEKLLEDHVKNIAEIQARKNNSSLSSISENSDTASTEAINEASLELQRKFGVNRVKIQRDLQYRLTEIDDAANADKLTKEGNVLQQQLANANLLVIGAGDANATELKMSEDIQAKITANEKEQALAQKKIRDDKRAQNKADLAVELDAVQTFADQSLQILQASTDGQIDTEKNKLAEKQTLADEQEKRDIDAVNASSQTAEQKAAQITIIEARATADKAQNDAKQKRLDYEKAKFDKQIAELQIIAAIAVDIAKGNYVAAALGGSALAKLILTPVPKYKSGRGTGKQEIAIVGDGGVSEYIHRANGSIQMTPAVETLTHLMPSDKIYKNKEQMMKELALSGLPLSNFHVKQDGSIDKVEMRKMTNEIVSAVDNIHINTTLITKGGWKNVNSRFSKNEQWIQKYIKG